MTAGSRWLAVEGAVLAGAVPVLLFPEQAWAATVLVLGLLAVIWLVRAHVLPATPFNLALIGWGLAVMVGIGVTADPVLTLPKATGLILGLAVWRYLAIYGTDQWVLVWSLRLFSLLGVGFVGMGVWAGDWQAKFGAWEGWVRWMPAFSLPLAGVEAAVQLNQLAGILVFLLPVALSLSLALPNKRHRYTAVGLSGLGVVLLILSQSRSGWLAAIAGTVPLLLFYHRQVARHRWWFIGISLLFIGLVGYGQFAFDQNFASTPTGNLDSLAFRQQVWHWAVAGIQQFPLTGTGLGSFRVVAARLYPLDSGNIVDIAHAHNIFLQVGLDAGIPGLITYLAILQIAIFTAWNNSHTLSTYRPWSIGLLFGIIALHLFGLTDALAPGSKPALLYWWALGLLTAFSRLLPATNADLPAVPSPTNLSPHPPPTTATPNNYLPLLMVSQPN